MPPKLLICDLDNTLYDWVRYFVPAFYSMVDVAAKILNCDGERLLDDLRFVHQKYHDTEHPFALLEADIVRETYPGLPRSKLKELLDDAFHAFNASRLKNLYAYSDVIRTLEKLSASGIYLVAHTESKRHTAVDRLNRLKIGQYFSVLFCQERSLSVHPEGRARPLNSAYLPKRVVELDHSERKPNPLVLLDICRTAGFLVSDAAYIGDSLAKDMLMAKQAHCYAVWAKYGTLHDKSDYEKLVRVSHWTEEDVRRERELSHQAQDISPDATVNCFSEVVTALHIEKSHLEILSKG